MIPQSPDPTQLSPKPSGPFKEILRGMLLLASGKEEGIHKFPQSSEGILFALTPWVALNIVNLGMEIVSLRQNTQISFLFVSVFLCNLCMLLAPLVVTHWLANRWDRERQWYRYGAASLWCQWMPALLLIVLVLFSGIFIPFLVGSHAYIVFLMLFLIVYSVWMNWFVIKVGLQISSKQSIIAVILNMIVAFILGMMFVGWIYALFSPKETESLMKMLFPFQ